MEENTPENKFRAKDDRIFRWCWMPECAIGGVSLALCDGIFLSADSINDDAGNRLSGCQSPTSARLFVDQSRYWIVPDTRNGKKRRLRRRRRRQITDEQPWPAWPWVAGTASLVLWWRNFSGIGRAGWQGENRCRSSWPFLLLGYDKRQTASENCGRYSRSGSERTSRVGRAGWAEWTSDGSCCPQQQTDRRETGARYQMIDLTACSVLSTDHRWSISADPDASTLDVIVHQSRLVITHHVTARKSPVDERSLILLTHEL